MILAPFVFLLVPFVGGESIEPLRSGQIRGLRVWDCLPAGSAPSKRPGFVRYRWRMSLKNETRHEIATVTVQMHTDDGRGSRPIGQNVTLRRFENLYVPYGGSLLPSSKTAVIPDFAIELPVSELPRGTPLGLSIVGATGFVSPDLHNAGHLFSALYNGTPSANLNLLRRDPSLLKVRTAEGLTTTLIAFGACDQTVVRYVLAHGGVARGRSNSGMTPMHLAALTRYPGTLDIALQAGNAVDDRTSLGMTPLMQAVIGGNALAWRWLLQHKANPNAKVFGTTVAGIAIFQGQPQALADLARVGAKSTIRGSNGRGWMHFAATNYAMLDTVASYGIPIDDRNPNDGTTPLMLSASRGEPGGVAWLLQHGANPRLKDKHGRDAFFYASEGGVNLPYLIQRYGNPR